MRPLTDRWPDADDCDRTGLLGGSWRHRRRARRCVGARTILGGEGAGLARLRRLGPWLIALAVLLAVWEMATAKLDLLPRPFFAAPQALLEVFTDDWRRLGDSVLRSLLLLLPAYAIGAAVGFLTGVAVGWSRAVGYWVHPVLRLIGPLPAIGLAAARLLRLPDERQRQHLPRSPSRRSSRSRC